MAARRPTRKPKPTLAVYKFASCDGCQLSLLDAEDELLAVAGEVTIANFPEASREVLPGPYDIALVEGSITTPQDAARILEVREAARVLVTIGACATAGGIQALRNWKHVDDFTALVYPHPEFIDALQHSTPVAYHVDVDYELRGCPVDKAQLLGVLEALLHGRRPNLPTHSVCVECKERTTACLMVRDGTPCLGPVTQSGCGALCPVYGRGCYGCFGPMEDPNTAALADRLQRLGVPDRELVHLFRSFNAYADAFRDASDRHEADLIVRGAAR